MSDLRENLAADFLTTTTIYEVLRNEVVARDVGKPALLAYLDYQANGPRILEGEAIDAYTPEQASADAAQREHIVEGLAAFDAKAAQVFGKVDGYEPYVIDARMVTLVKTGETTATSLSVVLDDDGKLLTRKTVSPLGRLYERKPVDTTDEDIEMLIRAVEQLQIVSSRINHSLPPG